MISIIIITYYFWDSIDGWVFPRWHRKHFVSHKDKSEGVKRTLPKAQRTQELTAFTKVVAFIGHIKISSRFSVSRKLLRQIFNQCSASNLDQTIAITRSSWFNCALRGDEAVNWVKRGHLCLYAWSGVSDASRTDWSLPTLTKLPHQLVSSSNPYQPHQSSPLTRSELVIEWQG